MKVESIELKKQNLFEKIKQSYTDWNYMRNKRKLDKLLDEMVSKKYDYVEQEFRALGYPPINEGDDPDTWIQENVIQLLKVFNTQGHSGASAPYAIEFFYKLAKGIPLSPLSGEDVEWVEVHRDDTHAQYQNRRCSSVFKRVALETGEVECYDIDGKVFWEWADHSETGEKYKFYYTNYECKVPVTFPYTVPDQPEEIYREIDDA